jgi:hypothetical protein
MARWIQEKRAKRSMRMSDIDERLDMALVWGPHTEVMRKQVRFCLPTRKTKKGWVPPAPVASDFQYVPREAYMKALEPLIQLLAEFLVEDILKEQKDGGQIGRERDSRPPTL